MNRQRIAATLRHVYAAGMVFARWWVSELAAAVPASVKEKLFSPKDATIISVNDNEAIVRQYHANNVLKLNRVPINSLRNAAAASRAPAIVVVNDNETFIDRFEMPRVAEARLRQAIQFEAERRSPFHAHNVCFDFNVIGQNADRNMLQIECASVPLNIVERAQGIAQSLGYYPVAIGLDVNPKRNLRYTFIRRKLPMTFRFKRSSWVLICAVGFVLFSLMVFSYERLQERAVIAQAIHDMKDQVAQATQTKTEAEKANAAIAFISARMKEPDVLTILLGLTKTLPDDTWVSELNLDGNEIRIAGYSSSASSLIERLTAEPEFSHPRFRAALVPKSTAPADKNIERFDLALTIPARSDGKESNQ